MQQDRDGLTPPERAFTPPQFQASGPVRFGDHGRAQAYNQFGGAFIALDGGRVVIVNACGHGDTQLFWRSDR